MANVFPDHPDRRNNQQQLCLDAGRALLLCGALVLVAIPPAAFGFVDPADATPTATRAFMGFLLWIVGAWLCLLALTPRAPRAVRGAAAAVASAVLKYCLVPPVNH